MRNIYISFLGKNDYEPCIYYTPNHRTENVRFVQEATLSEFCRDWTEKDKLFIFTTGDAEIKNWRDGGHTRKNGFCEGLKTRIAALNLRADVCRVHISDGTSEDEIWDIFSSVYNLLEPHDTLIFDITHAFRSIPMLAIVVLNYAKVLKNVSLKGIYYGAFEVLGHISEVKKMPMKDRLAPIIDLSAFDTLLEWSSAIDHFLKSGDARLVDHLSQSSLHPILRDKVELREEGNSLKKLAKSLAEFGKTIATCRGPKITPKSQNVRQNLDACGDIDLIPALKPLLEKLRPQVERFTGDDVKDGIQAARWCLDHQLIQQGYTILQETLVTHFVRLIGADPMEKQFRSIVTSAAHIIRENIPPDQWEGDAARHQKKTRKMIALLENAELEETLNNLTAERNDLNHAGYKKNLQKTDKFFKNLEKHIRQAEAIITLIEKPTIILNR